MKDDTYFTVSHYVGLSRSGRIVIEWKTFADGPSIDIMHRYKHRSHKSGPKLNVVKIYMFICYQQEVHTKFADAVNSLKM